MKPNFIHESSIHTGFFRKHVYLTLTVLCPYCTDDFCTQPVWWHIMGIAVPDDIGRPEYGGLFIGGEDNTMTE